MKLDEVQKLLDAQDFKVDVRPTLELFPYKTLTANHHSVVCSSEADQLRVYHWIQFTKSLFEDFELWAVYVVALVETPKPEPMKPRRGW